MPTFLPPLRKPGEAESRHAPEKHRADREDRDREGFDGLGSGTSISRGSRPV